jgi:hypothetical protein
MSIEQSMILRARPEMLANRLAAVVAGEITKGCLPEISPQPCRLEPRFRPLFSEPTSETVVHAAGEAPIPTHELTRLRLWVSPNQDCEWNRSELFLKQLSRLSRRLGYEISGNQKGIYLSFLAHRDDTPVVATAFRSLFEESEVAEDFQSPLLHLRESHAKHIMFRDYYPPPPYSHLLTSYDELKSTPFAGLIQALSQIHPPAFGFYQCLFQPVAAADNWHNNVEVLLDIEFRVKLHNTVSPSRQHLQQAPSGDLRQMAREVDTKAHNDRPFFFAAVRVGVCDTHPVSESDLRALTAFMDLFQHGGRPLHHLTEVDYERVLPRVALPRMIHRGITLRPGFLVNSRELVGLAHLFRLRLTETRRVPLQPLESLSVRDPSLLEGTGIGICYYAGVEQRVCIPPSIRQRSTHAMSSSGMGKSTVLLNMFLQDVISGKGAVFIDVHGDAIKKALTIIPPDLYAKCVYFAPGDSDWIPVWNPMALPLGGNIYRRADDIVSSFRRVFTDWGDRLEHVIRNGVIGLSYLSRTSLLDLYSLVRQGSAESEQLRKQIVKAAKDEPVRKFWQTDFLKDYRKSDLQAPKHKLSKLVSAGNVSLMLSQWDSRIDFRKLMDEGQIMLVDLSSLGSDLAEILGAFILSLLLSTAMSRSDVEEEDRKPFSIFADEAHRFVAADAIENIIAQARKFGIDLCIAHQYLSQFESGKADALSTTGCTILGHLDKRDSQYFAKDMQDLVEPKDLIRLGPHEMIARIGKEVVRFKTLDPPRPAVGGDWRRLVEESRRKYCRRADEIRADIARRSERWHQPYAPLSGDIMEWPFTPEDLAYDEF